MPTGCRSSVDRLYGVQEAVGPIPATPTKKQQKRVETPKLGVSTKLTLGVIINQFKRACTMFARINNVIFNWQPLNEFVTYY